MLEAILIHLNYNYYVCLKGIMLFNVIMVVNENVVYHWNCGYTFISTTYFQKLQKIVVSTIISGILFCSFFYGRMDSDHRAFFVTS